MRTYTKILLTVLPLVLFFLALTFFTSIYLSRSALNDLAKEWLFSRSSETMEIVKTQENILHTYGLENISASNTKAKLDTIKELSSITIGTSGFVFGVDSEGVIFFHPDKYFAGTEVSGEQWFSRLKKEKVQLFLTQREENFIAVADFFPSWNWYILVAAPESEIYGAARKMQLWLALIGCVAALIISLALMILTKRILHPLQTLVEGAERIGKGDLDTQLSIQSKDEFSNLAREFNQMSLKLKQSSAELENREEFFRALFENATDLITISDKTGKIIYTSPSTKRILGYSAEKFVGQNVFDFIHPDEKEGVIDYFQKRIQSKIPARILEFRFQHSDGYWCTLESMSSNLLDHPVVRGFVVNSRNISKRKLAEDALKQSNEELELRVEKRTKELSDLNKALNKEIEAKQNNEIKSIKNNQTTHEFLGSMSHEIKTHLNSILGFNQLLFSSKHNKPEKTYLNAIQSAGESLLTLTNNISDLSRLASGKFELIPVSTDVHGMLDTVYEMFRPKIEEKPILFVKDLDDGLPPRLILDDIRLQMVMINLIDNALTFTKNGFIKITTRMTQLNESRTEVDLSISIEDTGIGMSEQKLSTLFNTIKANVALTKDGSVSKGIGLTICKHLIELMGGTLDVQSEIEKGTKFEFSIPNVKISKQTIKSKKHIPINLETLEFSNETILVANDRDPIRFMLCEMLEKTGLNIVESKTQNQTIALAKEEKPDIILLDSGLIKSGSVATTSTLKQNSITKYIPILLCIDSLEEISSNKLNPTHFQGYLIKPIDVQKLFNELVVLLNKSMEDVNPFVSNNEILSLDSIKSLVQENKSFKDQLQSDVYSLIPNAENGIIITDVLILINNIMKLGKSFENAELQAFGQLLKNQSDVYDFDRLSFNLNYLYDTLRSLNPK